MFLHKCPYCKDGSIEVRDKEVRGKKVKLYACSNAHWKSEDGELFELTKESKCSFKIWQNSLSKYGKWFCHAEVKELLKNGTIEVELVSKKYAKTIKYKKDVVLDIEYGVSVIWD